MRNHFSKEYMIDLIDDDLSRSPKLKFLKLVFFSSITVDGIKSVLSHGVLKELALENCESVDLNKLGPNNNLRTMQKLCVLGMNLKSSVICQMENLKSLQVSGEREMNHFFFGHIIQAQPNVPQSVESESNEKVLCENIPIFENLEILLLGENSSNFDGSFIEKCQHLKELEICTSFKEVDSHSFSTIISLKILTIDSISVAIKDESLMGLFNLEKLKLRNCVVTFLTDGAFQRLNRLKVLYFGRQVVLKMKVSTEIVYFLNSLEELWIGSAMNSTLLNEKLLEILKGKKCIALKVKFLSERKSTWLKCEHQKVTMQKCDNCSEEWWYHLRDTHSYISCSHCSRRTCQRKRDAFDLFRSRDLRALREDCFQTKCLRCSCYFCSKCSEHSFFKCLCGREKMLCQECVENKSLKCNICGVLHCGDNDSVNFSKFSRGGDGKKCSSNCLKCEKELCAKCYHTRIPNDWGHTRIEDYHSFTDGHLCGEKVGIICLECNEKFFKGIEDSMEEFNKKCQGCKRRFCKKCTNSHVCILFDEFASDICLDFEKESATQGGIFKSQNLKTFPNFRISPGEAFVVGKIFGLPDYFPDVHFRVKCGYTYNYDNGRCVTSIVTSIVPYYDVQIFRWDSTTSQTKKFSLNDKSGKFDLKDGDCIDILGLRFVFEIVAKIETERHSKNIPVSLEELKSRRN